MKIESPVCRDHAFWGLTGPRLLPTCVVLAASILLTATPILLLMGTGWVQFGPRYTLDFTVPLLMLTALGIKSWPRLIIGLLVLVSIGHYVLGTLFLSGILA